MVWWEEGLLYVEQDLATLNRIALGNVDLAHLAVGGSGDLGFHLHRLKDDDDLAGLDLVALSDQDLEHGTPPEAR